MLLCIVGQSIVLVITLLTQLTQSTMYNLLSTDFVEDSGIQYTIFVIEKCDNGMFTQDQMDALCAHKTETHVVCYHINNL